MLTTYIASTAYNPVITPHCQAHLDAWCHENCPHSAEHKLYARYDSNHFGHPATWRCYAASTLDAKLQKYVQGETFCTRHPQLLQQRQICEASDPENEAFDSEDAYGPDGDAAPAPPPPIKRTPLPHPHMPPPTPQATATRAAAAKMATAESMTTRAPQAAVAAVSADGTCADSVAECAVWARYDECRQNAAYMNAECAVSCNKCDGNAKAAGLHTPRRRRHRPHRRPHRHPHRHPPPHRLPLSRRPALAASTRATRREAAARRAPVKATASRGMTESGACAAG